MLKTNNPSFTVAEEPTNLTALIYQSNSSHVNVTVYWESPADPVTGYGIYYQTKGGPVISDMVSGGETETHSLDGLQRGVTYYISILALSQHLPSPLVGPVSFGVPHVITPTSMSTSQPNDKLSTTSSTELTHETTSSSTSITSSTNQTAPQLTTVPLQVCAVEHTNYRYKTSHVLLQSSVMGINITFVQHTNTGSRSFPSNSKLQLNIPSLSPTGELE